MCPLLHTHWERAVCPVASVTEFTGQAVQASKDTAVRVEYLPAPQLMHAAVPSSALYVPAAHGAHALLHTQLF